MDLLYFNSRMLLSFNFIFSFKIFLEVFPLKENSIIQLWTISFTFIKSLFMWWKFQKSFRVIFAKSGLFLCFLFGVKRFFQKPLYFLFKFLFLKLVKKLSQPHLSAWPTCRRRPTWSNPTRWLGQTDRSLPSLTSLLPLAHALATASPRRRRAWFWRPPPELAAEMGVNR
jgi:hypothetical protein